MKKIFIAIFVLACFTSNAQVTTSNISGVVYDVNKQLLPGANITALHEPTGN